MVACAAIAAFLVLGSTGCDDNDNRFIIGSTTLGPPGSTTTTSTTSTTSTTMTTTTTMGAGGGPSCTIDISQTSGETLGSLQWNTDYSGAGGGFTGSADMVDCTSPLSAAGAIVTFNDDEAALTLRTGIISLAGFTGPTVVASCTFANCADPDPVAGDFALTLVDAADPSFNPQTPTLAITNITCTPPAPAAPECAGATTTTSTTSTTTTSTTTTSTVGGGGASYTIVMEVVEAQSYGALQWNVDYSSAAGGFAGSADMVACTSPLSAAGAIVTFNDDEAASTLRTGIISLSGFNGPATVASCTFDSTGGAPVAGDFAITTIDASDPSLMPIAPLPTIQISSITAN
jgi:hypothetical protein